MNLVHLVHSVPACYDWLRDYIAQASEKPAGVVVANGASRTSDPVEAVVVEPEVDGDYDAGRQRGRGEVT